jgi:hypothetical protein
MGGRIAALVVLAALVQTCPAIERRGAKVPFHVYLTWQGDTSTTMTVNFQTRVGGAIPIVYYDDVPRDGQLERYADATQGTSHQIDGLQDGRYIHSVQLTGLEPGTTYYFAAVLDGAASAEERTFRTIPSGDDPIRFITGGDMNIRAAEKALLRHASKADPMFGLIGGDIAYANGNLDDYRRWDAWLRHWESIMVTSDGHMIPMVLAVGNHEVATSYGGATEDAPFYTGYFAQGSGRSYFTLTFGPGVVIYVLDTGHLAAHGGDQGAWLAQTMAEHRESTHQFAVYHVPLYPSHREFENMYSVIGRREWGPIFDRYGLDTAFENHDHMFKRSKRLKAGAVDATGTMYLGDGCFGRAPRSANMENMWYLDAASGTRHFWLVEVSGPRVAYTAINTHGDIIDHVETEK